MVYSWDGASVLLTIIKSHHHVVLLSIVLGYHRVGKDESLRKNRRFFFSSFFLVLGEGTMFPQDKDVGVPVEPARV